MKRKNLTRNALFTSIISMLLCVSMLVGTTFAWFTDSVVSANNVIASGNLDVVLQYKTKWSDDWAPVDETTKIFDETAKYEPGYTEIVFLRVSNAGSLALKYNLTVNVTGETPSTNVFGEEFKLSDYIKIGAYKMSEYNGDWIYSDTLFPYMFGSRESALSNVGPMTTLADFSVAGTGPVEPGDKTAQVIALVLNMPETVGNEANHKTGVAAPTVTLGVTLQATQLVYEEDSFGSDYDKDAVATADELAAAIAAGGNVILAADIDLGAEQISIPAGASVTLDLNGHDLSGSFTGADHYAMFNIDKGASLTVNGNGNVVANTCATENNRFLSIFENAGNLTINGGNYTVDDTTTGKTWIIATIVDNRTTSTSSNAVLTINGGTFSVVGNAKNLFRNYPQQGGSATLTINGGTFKANPNGTTYIWNQEAGSYPGYLNFMGGTYDANVVYEDYNGQSDITIANGVIINAYSGNS